MSVEDLLAMLSSGDQRMRYTAIHTLGALGPEMDDRVIEHILAHAYPHAKCILIELARVAPKRIAVAMTRLVLANHVFPVTAGVIAGPPHIYVGEQVRRDGDGYVVANCRDAVRRFASLDQAIDFFIDAELLGRGVSQGYYMRNIE